MATKSKKTGKKKPAKVGGWKVETKAGGARAYLEFGFRRKTAKRKSAGSSFATKADAALAARLAGRGRPVKAK